MSFISLCRSNLESVEHIFLHCSFFKVVWKEASNHFSIFFNWDLGYFEDCFLSWLGSMKNMKVFPYFVFWEI